MKNAIIFLLLLGNVGVVGAQISVLPQQTLSYAPPYKCTITNPNPWTENDLITWIFPDGQYMKSEIDLDNGIVQNHTDMVTWTPCASLVSGAPSGPNDIQAFIAKKGGTGNPPQFTLSFIGAYNTTAQPVENDIIGAHKWQLNKSWELSPSNETFLYVSYERTGCPTPPLSTDNIELRFNNDQLFLGSVLNTDFYKFNYETIDPSIAGQDKTVLIKNFSDQELYNNIFFKVKVQPQVTLGQTINIFAKGTYCGDNHTDTLQCIVQRSPHDPNSKIVDIKTLNTNQTDPVELTYTVQFHNDGTAPVTKVEVMDQLPPQLDPSTFSIVDFQPMNGITQYTPNTQVDFLSQGDTKVITFEGYPGLPGLGQLGYAYDQTIFRYKFKVKTRQGNQNQNPINNTATVTFFESNGKELEQVVTSVATVEYINCTCWKIFWQNFFNIFRRDKKEPCKRSQKGK